MASATVNSVIKNVAGSRRQFAFDVNIAASGDTLVTGLKQVDAVLIENPIETMTSAVSAGTVTFNYGISAQITLGSSNSAVTFDANTPGAGGNSTTVAIVIAGNNTPLSISVVGSAITINAATGAGGAATTTSAQAAAAVNADINASKLVTAVAGGTGAGVVAAASATNLAGGSGGGPISDLKLIAQGV